MHCCADKADKAVGRLTDISASSGDIGHKAAVVVVSDTLELRGALLVLVGL